VEWIDEEAVVTTDFKFRIGCTTFRVRTSVSSSPSVRTVRKRAIPVLLWQYFMENV
jgi:hypothetical protein